MRHDLIMRLRDGINPDEGAFDAEPPAWARDPFNEDMADKCGRCGSWRQVVRPGKTQCTYCWDDDIRAMRLEAAAALEAIHATPPEQHDEDAVVERIARERAARLAEIFGEDEVNWCLHVVGLQSVLSALKPGDRLPGGLVCVPGEPSDVMLGAFDRLTDDNGVVLVKTAYRAMLAAASTD